MDYNFELQRFLEALLDGDDAGIPAGNYEGLPLPVNLVADEGDPADGWSPGTHVHTAAAGQVSFSPTATIPEDDVQSAIEGLDARKLGHVRTMIRAAVWR